MAGLGDIRRKPKKDTSNKSDGSVGLVGKGLGALGLDIDGARSATSWMDAARNTIDPEPVEGVGGILPIDSRPESRGLAVPGLLALPFEGFNRLWERGDEANITNPDALAQSSRESFDAAGLAATGGLAAGVVGAVPEGAVAANGIGARLKGLLGRNGQNQEQVAEAAYQRALQRGFIDDYADEKVFGSGRYQLAHNPAYGADGSADLRILKDGTEIGMAEVVPNGQGGVHIANITTIDGSNSLGLTGVRELREAFREYAPAVTSFSGRREYDLKTGAAGEAIDPNGSRQQSVTLAANSPTGASVPLLQHLLGGRGGQAAGAVPEGAVAANGIGARLRGLLGRAPEPEGPYADLGKPVHGPLARYGNGEYQLEQKEVMHPAFSADWGTSQNFNILRNGEPIGRASTIVKDGRAHVESIAAQDGSNALGLRGVRDLREAFREYAPEVTNFRGDRVFDMKTTDVKPRGTGRSQSVDLYSNSPTGASVPLALNAMEKPKGLFDPRGVANKVPHREQPGMFGSGQYRLGLERDKLFDDTDGHMGNFTIYRDGEPFGSVGVTRDDGVAHIDQIDVEGGSNSLGVSGLRDLREAFREFDPSIKTFSGDRDYSQKTGAAGAAVDHKGGREQSVYLPANHPFASASPLAFTDYSEDLFQAPGEDPAGDGAVTRARGGPVSLARITTNGGVPFTVSAEHAPKFLALLNDLEARGYPIQSNQSGGYNDRNIAGTNTKSQHAFGNAVDVNWTDNPRGGMGKIPADVARELARQHDMVWGGDWKNPDPMHFEVARGGGHHNGDGHSHGLPQLASESTPQLASLDYFSDKPISLTSDQISTPPMALGGPREGDDLFSFSNPEPVVEPFNAQDYRTSPRNQVSRQPEFVQGPLGLMPKWSDGSMALQGFKDGGRVAGLSGLRVAVPTEAQKEAGNYKKAHVTVQGLDITIENPKGSERSGVDKGGKRWSVKMPDHYGYFKRTLGKDGDHVDCYVGPEPDSGKAYVVDQVDASTGQFDEHKVMLGYTSEANARSAYCKAFSDGKANDRIGDITPISVEGLKTWLRSGNTKRPLGKQKFASGGSVMPSLEGGGSLGAPHAGALHSTVPGRTDHLPIEVTAGAFVIPADIISALGEGNTNAGMTVIEQMFPKQSPRLEFARGGAVPILAAGGEFVLSPEQVAAVGGGDLNAGHDALDAWVVGVRNNTIKTLMALPPPVKD